MKRPAFDDPQELFIRSVVNNDHLKVERMISEGLDVNFLDFEGRYPLNYAAVHGSLEAAKILIEHGADVNCVDRNGNTPLSDAVFYAAGNLELIKFLLGNGADENRENLHGISPRNLASSIGNFDYSECFPE